MTTVTILNGMFISDADLIPTIVDANAFLQAMGDAGLGASQNSGSPVVFQSIDEERGWMGREIVFHKPHPFAKVDAVRMKQ